MTDKSDKPDMPGTTPIGSLRWNLCDPERVVNGYRFTCSDKADHVTTHICTGSEHLAGMPEIICSCECHTKPQPPFTVTVNV